MTDATAFSADVREAADVVREGSRYWWILLLTGCGWLLFSIVIFRFDWKSVSSISILFGCSILAAGLAEFATVAGVSGGWKIAHAALGLVFVAIGVVAFIHPGNTFAALAGVLSFYLVLQGAFSVAVALSVRGELWWLELLLGLSQLALGFWAAGDFGHKTVLLLVWVGASALIRGISQIAAAFAFRSIRNAEV